MQGSRKTTATSRRGMRRWRKWGHAASACPRQREEISASGLCGICRKPEGNSLLLSRLLDVSGYLVIYFFVGLVVFNPLIAGNEFGDHGLARREFLEFL